VGSTFDSAIFFICHLHSGVRCGGEWEGEWGGERRVYFIVVVGEEGRGGRGGRGRHRFYLSPSLPGTYFRSLARCVAGVVVSNNRPIQVEGNAAAGYYRLTHT
jgi:hypothetical protein